MIEKIKIKNLTVFEDLEIDTSAPINVFIGENGTGKTQILKFTYMLLNSNKIGIKRTGLFLSPLNSPFVGNFFGTGFNDLTDLLHNNIINCTKSVTAKFVLSNQKGFRTTYGIKNPLMCVSMNKVSDFIAGEKELMQRSAFLPAKDMLTHSRGLPAMKKEYGRNMPFDESYVNIIEKASKWNKAEVPEIAKNIVPILEDIMDGVVEIVNEVFYIKKRNGKMISFDFEAEGIKKIGLLWQLLMSGTITKDTILLWDEPESNLNPKLSSIIAHMLLELSRNGVQIFLTTHSYFLAEYFDVLEKDKKEVVFHSLYREDDNWESPVLCETSDTFSKLAHNTILDERVRLFDAELEKEFSS